MVMGLHSQLASIGVANEEPNRQALREMLFTAEGVESHISGVVSVLACPLRVMSLSSFLLFQKMFDRKGNKAVEIIQRIARPTRLS